MSKQRVITVLGATGAQGGGLARAILADPKREFTARAVTRKPDSPQARALAAAGAEIVAADLDDVSSLERAMQGAHGVFGVTNFWEHFSAPKEYEQATHLAEAARRAAVAHVIWSTLEDTREVLPADGKRMPVLSGRYNVPHFDAKGEANKEFTSRGLPVTLLFTSFYWDNFIHFGMGPKPGPDGELAFAFDLGDAKLPAIAASDIGGVALAVFKQGQAAIGRSIGIAGEHLSGHEMAEIFTRVLGRKVRYDAVSPETYRSFGFPGADDLGNMFQFKRDFEQRFRAPRDVAATRRLFPQLQTFEQWLRKNRDAFASVAAEAA
jgi:uncharacterized protein YbjT (DUF2867 family)